MSNGNEMQAAVGGLISQSWGVDVSMKMARLRELLEAAYMAGYRDGEASCAQH